MSYRKSVVISRVPYVTREEKDQTGRAKARVCLPLCDLSKGNQDGLTIELEIALANISMRKEENKAKKVVKSLKTGETIRKKERNPLQEGM